MIKKIKNATLAILSALAITGSGLATAHKEPVEAGWCTGGKISVIGHFQLNQRILALFKGPENAVCLQQKSCGQFDDDDYGVGLKAANGLCHLYSVAELELRSIADHLTVRPIFYSPNSFRNSEANHHELYSIEQGIEFSCGICEMPVGQKVTR